MPSYVETYGTVYGEALAAGLPTSAGGAGNLPNLITDGGEGCLVPPGDVDGLAPRSSGWPPTRLAGAARRRRPPAGSDLPTWDEAADAFFGALRRLVQRRG